MITFKEKSSQRITHPMAFFVSVVRLRHVVALVVVLVAWIGVAPSAQSQCPCNLSCTFTGAAGDQLGYSVSRAGDVDGDGFDDVIVGAPGADQAYIYSGPNCNLLCTLTGGTGDLFGWSVSGAGDVNGDGFDDVIVGAPKNGTGGTAAGQAYVYSGSNCNVLCTLTGATAGSQLGWSVSEAGDLNGDGLADVIVGAPQNGTGGTAAGQAYVYSGPNCNVLCTLSSAVGELFGWSVSGVGDVNGDGLDEVIVGAPHSGGIGFFKAGRAYVYYYSASALRCTLLCTITGEAAGDQLGFSVSEAGDVDGDGLADMIVGAPFNGAGGRGAGRVYVFRGPNCGLFCSLTGVAAGDHFGFSVSGAGDVNRDGSADLIVGAPFSGAGGIAAGQACVYSGSNCMPLCILTGAAGDHFGFSVSGAGYVTDVNLCFPDVIVGAPFNGAGGVAAGEAYVYTSPCSPADCNGDCTVNILDALWEINCILSDVPPGCSCDCNGDGTDNILDVLCIINCILYGDC